MSKLGKQLAKTRLILKRPRLTEKAGLLSAAGAHPTYTFEVATHATKPLIKKAVQELYKVVPVKINVVNVPAKTIFARGKKGRRPGLKKAVVQLKSGEKIEFV